MHISTCIMSGVAHTARVHSGRVPAFHQCRVQFLIEYTSAAVYISLLCCCIQYIQSKHSLLSIRKITPTVLHRRNAFMFALLSSCIATSIKK